MHRHARSLGTVLGVALSPVLGLLLWMAIGDAQPAGLVDLSGFGSTQGVALALSQRTFTAADSVLIGRDDVFADALASGVLQRDRPLLLTATDGVDEQVADEIDRLGATGAVLLGGEAALSAAVADELAGMGLEVERLEGPSRVETAVAVAAAGQRDGTVLLVRAFDAGEATQGFADSLAVGGWAADTGFGVLLTATEGLSAATAEALQAGEVDEVVIVGGEAAISNQVAADLALLGLPFRRVAGPTRSHTAVEVARARGFDSVADAATVVVVESRTVDAWAAGFAGAAAAGVWDAPILLVEDGVLADVTREWLTPPDGFAQARTDAPRLVCAATAEVCAEVAELIGAAPEPTASPTPTATDGPLDITFAADGGSLHRNAPILATVTGADRPATIVLDGLCVVDAPVTVPVAADGAVQAMVTDDAAADFCTIQARSGGVDLGDPADVLIEVGQLELPTVGDFNDPSDPFEGSVTGAGPLADVTFDAECLEPDGVVLSDPTTFAGEFTGMLGWCSVSVTAEFPDGGFQTFPGPEIPNTYVCGGIMVTEYDRSNNTYWGLDAFGQEPDVGQRTDDPSTTYVVDGEAVSQDDFEAALSHGDCVTLPAGQDVLTNVDTGCPTSLYMTGVVFVPDPFELEGGYNEDAGGLRVASEFWIFEQDDAFVIGGDPTSPFDFALSLTRTDCVRFDVNPEDTHTLVNRDWRGP